MEAYAVIETGGKQYRVRANDVVAVESLPEEVGKGVTFNSVLALSDGKTLKVGTPFLDAAKVTGSVVEHLRGPKLISFKKKRRKGYTRKVGHRQGITRVRIEALA